MKKKTEKQGIEKEYYVKIGRRYEKMKYWDFPSIPADGLWLVQNKENSSGQSCISRLGDIPRLNVKMLGALSKYEDECANMLYKMENNPIIIKKTNGEEIGYIPSASERIKTIFNFLASKHE
jgi:hypothetical protein